MREVVIHGIVEVMNDRQIADRSESLGAALGRMSVARDERSPITTLDASFDQAADLYAEADRRPMRRRLFSFGERGRSALDRLAD